nr:unnamed protein product [Callosobruchus analis]
MKVCLLNVKITVVEYYLNKIKDSFIVTIPCRSGSTLLAKIIENIADSSIIYSNSWKGYQTNRIEIEGFLHAKVNHQYNFIDPDTGVRTQIVERMWDSAK